MDLFNATTLWAIAVIGGPIALAIAIVWAYLQRRRRNRVGTSSDAAVRKNWGKEDVRP